MNADLGEAVELMSGLEDHAEGFDRTFPGAGMVALRPLGGGGPTSAAAKRGLDPFYGKALCAELAPDDPLARHAFKTPGLRSTAPRRVR